MLPRRSHCRKLKWLVKKMTLTAANHEKVGEVGEVKEVKEVKEVEEAGLRDVVIE